MTQRQKNSIRQAESIYKRNLQNQADCEFVIRLCFFIDGERNFALIMSCM